MSFTAAGQPQPRFGFPFAQSIYNVTDQFEQFRVPFSERRFTLAVGDALMIFLAMWNLPWLLSQLSLQTPQSLLLIRDHWYWWLPIFSMVWWILGTLNDLYDIPGSYSKTDNLISIVVTGGLAFVLHSVARWFFPDLLSRLHFAYLLGSSMALLLAWRFFYTSVAHFIAPTQRVLILGSGERGQVITRLLQQNVRLNYKVLGYVDESLETATTDAEGKPVATAQIKNLPMMGNANDLAAIVKGLRVHEIVVAIDQDLNHDLFQTLIGCQAQGVQVSWMPDLYEKLHRCIPVQHVDPTWALCAMQGQALFNRIQLVSKRLLDLSIVFLSLPVFLFLMPILALAIRLDSPGPVFYRQVRSGRGNKPFAIFKFRTMVTDAEKDGQARWASKNDSRITRVGRFLRKTRLDELPQILNILKGEMSIVGPRPERPEFVEQLQKEIPFYAIRLMVKPGLTGWAQVHYDYGNTVEDALLKLQYDFYYIRYWSLWLDFYTVFKTFSVVFRFKGM